jgi:uncharacterized protein (DUF736 family)
MIIGTFEYNAETDTYFGNIPFLLDRKVHLKPVGKSGGKGPDYRVGASDDFADLEFGAGWKRTSESGTDYVSVAIDAPMFPAPVNAALFLDEGGRTATLVWRRQKAGEEASQEHAPAKPRKADGKAKAA